MSEEAEALEAEAQDLYVEIRDASVVKDEFLAEHRANAKELNDERDAKLGRAAALRKIDGMPEAEQQAILAELTKTGGG